MSVHYVFRRTPHHSPHSGYHRLAEFNPGCDVVDSKTLPVLLRLVLNNPLAGRCAKALSGLEYYSRRSLLDEATVLRDCKGRSGGIYHFLFGEDSFRFTGSLRRFLPRNVKLVATFHQPPALLRRVAPSPYWWGALDAAVVVGRNQIPVLSERLSRERVFFVPLGVDTQFFAPSQIGHGEDHPFTCVTVGNWLRDFDLLAEVIRKIHRSGVWIRFVVVSFPENLALLRDCEGVDLQTGLSDESLREVYRSADVLLLPLMDSTANVTLLEGLACGLPVVVSDVGGVRNYVDESCALFAPPKDSEAMASALLSLTHDRGLRVRMGQCSREKALNLDWTCVAPLMQRIYEQL